jgi:hypothetical protein
MRSTADKVLEACPQLKRQRDGSYRGASPYRPGSDSNGFTLIIHDGEHGAWKDFAREGEQGSLYDLARHLNIETPKGDRVQVENSKTPYEDLADYAKRHYSTLEVFKAAGWRDADYYGKKAIAFEAATGTRVRILEGSEKDLKNPYRWVGDAENENCWYGLARALRMANEKALPLVLCNGEASTVVAQSIGIPAFSCVGGEGSASEKMLSELNHEWNGQIYIALDCDEKGRLAADAMQKKLANSLILDLELSDKGDLADFVGLHRDLAMKGLHRIADKLTQENQESQAELIEFVSSHELLSQFHQFVWEDPSLFGRVIKMPFESMRRSGGFAELITTKKVWLIGNVSGGGKTIFSESLCDGWNWLGYNVLYIGDEWTAMEMTARRLLRANPTNLKLEYMDFLRFVDGSRDFSDAEYQALSLAARQVRTAKGQTFYMQTSTKFKGVVFLEDIMESVSRKLDTLRAIGIRIDIIVLDYLSLYDTRGKANNIEEYKVGVFKSYCKSLDVLGVTTSQVNKEAEDRVLHKGGFLTQHDLFWVRADKGNLISTMNRMYKSRIQVESNLDPKDFYKPYIDENGQPEPTPNFTLLTVKNSVASPFNYAYFHFDYERMAIREGLHPDYYYDEYEGAVLPKESQIPRRSAAPFDDSNFE